MMDEHVCAQDLREKELQELGYLNGEKAYFRLGRAIFIIDALKKDFTQNEAFGTPLGVAASLNNPGIRFDTTELEMLQNIFGSTAYLRIKVEGDPDGGISLIPNEVLLTGYRYGLDDVIIDGKLFDTTHGDHEEIMRNFADWIERRSWDTHVPDWETYEGVGYHMKECPELETQLRNVVEDIRELADKMEKKDDKPEWVKEKFRSSTPKVKTDE